MDPLTIGLITGGASLLGSIFSSNTSAQNSQANIQAQQQMQGQTQQFNAEQASLNRDFQANQVQINRDYQTQMSNSAYQRSTADMKAAGLNPMMMFNSGGGPASVPSGGSASGDSASVGTPNMALHANTSPLAGLGDAVSKTVSSAINAKTFDKMTEEIAQIQKQQALTSAITNTEKEKPAYVKQQTETEKQQTLETANRAQLRGLELPAGRFSAKSAEDLLSMPEWLRSSLNIGGFSGKKLDDVLHPLTSTARSFSQRFHY